MIDLRGHQKLEWPNELRPRGEGTWEKETFDLWWDRNKTLIAHIHPVVAEQWIYRQVEFTVLPPVPRPYYLAIGDMANQTASR